MNAIHSTLNLLKNKLLWIFLLALFLRIYNLENFPVGFHIDEVKVGWNALSILKTGADDQLNPLPIYYNSFGDFRPSGIFYITIPSIALLGNSIFATRFASSLIGSLSVFAIFTLVNAITKNKQISLFSALLLALSPWHISVSRATSEVVISAFFAIYAISFLIKLLELQKIKYLFFSSVFIFISYFFYHSVRILAPLYYLVILYFYRKSISRKVLIAFLVVISLTVYFTATGGGLNRLGQVSIFSSVDLNYQIDRTKNEYMFSNLLSKTYDNEYAIQARFILRQYLNYFSGEFLVGESARPYRYTTPGAGLLNIIELILLLIGIIEILKHNRGKLFIVLMIFSPIPAALTIEDTPNLHRAFFMLPFILTISAFGLYRLKNFRYLIYLFLIINFIYHSHMYINHSITHKPFIKDLYMDSPTYRNVGTIEVMDKVEILRKNYDKVIVTNYPDSPFTWYAFFNNSNPQINRSFNLNSKTRVVENVVFSEEKCPTDNSLVKYLDKKILMVNNWECDHESQIKAGLPVRVVDKVFRPDGSVAFTLLEKI